MLLWDWDLAERCIAPRLFSGRSVSVMKLGTLGNVFPAPSVLLGNNSAPLRKKTRLFREEVEELNYGGL
jgi:hypothetical protein